MRLRSLLFALCAVLAGGQARAEIVTSSDSAFVLRVERVVTAEPDQAWRAIGQIGRWWNPEHTYSGDARRMSLDVRAGGCFCERWSGQSVEHGRVVLVMEHEGVRTIRIDGALGPLQAMGADGVLTIAVAPDHAGAKLVMSYRVAGDASLDLDALAPAVEAVLLEQMARLDRYVVSGDPAQQRQ